MILFRGTSQGSLKQHGSLDPRQWDLSCFFPHPYAGMTRIRFYGSSRWRIWRARRHLSFLTKLPRDHVVKLAPVRQRVKGSRREERRLRTLLTSTIVSAVFISEMSAMGQQRTSCPPTESVCFETKNGHPFMRRSSVPESPLTYVEHPYLELGRWFDTHPRRGANFESRPLGVGFFFEMAMHAVGWVRRSSGSDRVPHSGPRH